MSESSKDSGVTPVPTVPRRKQSRKKSETGKNLAFLSEELNEVNWNIEHDPMADFKNFEFSNQGPMHVLEVR